MASGGNQLVNPVRWNHMTEINQWFKAWGNNMPDVSIFPTNGFIVEGVAAGFIYLTDSSLAIIDCFISNPDSNLETRNHALNAITEKLLELAARRHYSIIKCDTKLEAIKERALAFGFKPTGSHDSFVKVL